MSTVRIKPTEFNSTLKSILEEATEEDVEKVNEVAFEQAKLTVNDMRAASAEKFVKGSYSKGWTKRKLRLKDGYSTYTIYNKTDYRLAHLLEHGHRIVSQGKQLGFVNGREHIKPVEDKANERFAEAVKARLQA